MSSFELKEQIILIWKFSHSLSFCVERLGGGGGGGVKTFLHSIGRFEDERRFIVFMECNCL